MVDLVAEDVDVAIRIGSMVPESTDLVAHRLFAFRRVIVAALSYLKRRGEPKTPAALARHAALLHAVDAAGETWRLVSGDRATRVRMAVAFSSNAGHVLRALAIEGSGVALLPEWFIADDLARRALRIIVPGWHSEPVAVHALHRTVHRGEQRVRALLAHLKASYA